VARKADYGGDFAEFKAAVQTCPMTLNADGTLHYTGLYGDAFTFVGDDRLPEINREPIDLAPPLTFRSPFMNEAWATGLITIRKDKDESFVFRNLKVATTNDVFAKTLRTRFIVAQQFAGLKVNHSPPTKLGNYDVFVSVGTRDGTPQIAPPLPGHDGQRRYPKLSAPLYGKSEGPFTPARDKRHPANFDL